MSAGDRASPSHEPDRIALPAVAADTELGQGADAEELMRGHVQTTPRKKIWTSIWSEQPKSGREAGSFLASLILVFGEKSESGRQQMVVVFVAHVQYAWLVSR